MSRGRPPNNRRRCSVASYRQRLRENSAPDLGLEGLAHHQIDLEPEQIAEVVFELNETEQAGRLEEGHEDVQVAVGPVLVADVRAKEGEGRDVVTLRQGRQLLPQDLSKLVHVSSHVASTWTPFSFTRNGTEGVP